MPKRVASVAQHVGVVHLVDVVAGEDQDVLGIVVLDEGQVLIDGVGRAGEPGALLARGLVRGKDVDAAVVDVQIPGLAAADVAVELQRTVLGQHADGVDAGIRAVGEGKVNDAVLASERHAGFGDALGQRVQAGSLSAGQEHGDAGFLHGQPPLSGSFF